MDPKWRKRLNRASKCKECEFYRESYSGYEEGGYLEELECVRRPRISNLWSFPFIRDQTCFVPNFWFSEFSELVKGDDHTLSRAIKLWREKYEPKASKEES